MRALRTAFAIIASLGLTGAAIGQGARPSTAESFRVGTGNGALCQAQSLSADPAVSGMFDRAWAVVCRDAPKAVGHLYQLRRGGDAMALLAKSRGEAVECGAPASSSIDGIGPVTSRSCRTAGGIGYRILSLTKGKWTYHAQGYAGYDSALNLALRSVLADRVLDGQVEIATLGGSDAAGFARLQAQAMDPTVVLGEGYRRNNSGSYAEAAEYFVTLQERLNQAASDPSLTPAQRLNRSHEYLINHALQLSDLGEFAQADALFAKASAIATRDPIQLRLRRNLEAINRLNQQDYASALFFLDRPLAPIARNEASDSGALVLDETLTNQLNSGAPSARSIGLTQSGPLTPQERGAILDAQALQLRGTILRLTGKPAEARNAFARADSDVMLVRLGRVASIIRLRAQMMSETGLTHEAEGNFGEAERQLKAAITLIETEYPETAALNSARARLAAFLARRGRDADALALYAQVVKSTADTRGALTGFANQLAPYFALLAKDMAARPQLAADMFLAAQTLVRPGAADTMEVLNRELSGGTDEAARLFRQSVSLSRDIERQQIRIAQLTQESASDAAVKPQLAVEQAQMETFRQQQADTLTRLAAFPQYRAVSKDVLTLEELRAILKPGEAYLKLTIVGPAVFAIYIDGAGATGYRSAISADDLSLKVQALRDTISVTENGQLNTYPFDVKTARTLYTQLFGPVASRIAGAKHLIFEPDGAMLRLPVGLLVTDQAGVDAYTQRIARPGADDFDFRGIQWLGKSHAISTSVSARGFADSRRAAATRASREYLGFGENAAVTGERYAALTRGATDAVAAGPDCSWPASQWNRPISAAELNSAAAIAGGGSRGGTEVITGSAFTDSAIKAKSDLDQYRIVHFATHGLVTAPRPGCPARPALVTSFGGAGSDGLLQFAEIFDLKLNADLVILSACDTAGQASAEATRAAGIGTGGGSSLDGLVRAFIGAGGRSVVASHWPAPDEFDATRRLITGLFRAPAGTDISGALMSAQRALMDDANTSHPFYWAGFVLVGDGARPLLAAR